MRLRAVLAGVIAAGLGAFHAHAAGPLDFDFTVTGGSSFPGSFSGEIVGLTDNTASQAATSVFVDTASITFPLTLPYNTISDVVFNEFTVSGGQITAVAYNAFDAGLYEIALDYEGTYLFVNTPSGEIRTNSDHTFTGIAFTPITVTTVPEPASLSLIGVALFGLAAARRRKEASAAF